MARKVEVEEERVESEDDTFDQRQLSNSPVIFHERVNQTRIATAVF